MLKIRMGAWGSLRLACALSPLFFLSAPVRAETPGQTRVPVVFSGGYETDPVDRGRPVNLVAGALGVPPEVFREAFSHVKPAPAGTEPDPQQVRQNKAALMSALGRFGITNERLDEVSNRYRYVRSRGDMWPTKPAKAVAVVAKGAIVKFEVIDGGYGYNSAPKVDVPGVKENAGVAQLGFEKDFTKNGTVDVIVLNTDTPKR